MQYAYVNQVLEFSKYLKKISIFTNDDISRVYGVQIQSMEDKVANKNYAQAFRDIMEMQRESQFVSQDRLQAAISAILINSRGELAAQMILDSFKQSQHEESDMQRGQHPIARYVFQALYELKQGDIEAYKVGE